MCHSISVKNSQHNQITPTFNTDEEQIHDLMQSLLDKIDKELNPSNSTDTHVLFDASSSIQRYHSKPSTDNNNNYDNDTFLPMPNDENSLEDAFQPLDDYKLSIGILHNDNDENNQNINQNYNRVPSRKFSLFYLIYL